MSLALNHSTVLHAPPYKEVARDRLRLLIDPEEPNWVATDSRGAMIAALLDGRRSFGQIIEEYRVFAGTDWARAWLDCHTFLHDLLRAEFIYASAPARPSYPGRSRAIAPDRLRELWLHLTNACNLACSHCLVESSPDGIRGISTDEWFRIIEQALDLGVERFYITGGEPFVRDDIYRIIELITERAELIVLTNAMLLKGERLRRLAAFDPERLKFQVSLDGSRPEINDAVRGRGSFAATLAGIENLLCAGFAPTITTAVMRMNADDVPNVTRLAAQLGVRNHHLLWTHNRGRALSGDGLATPPVERLIEVVRRAIAVARENSIEIDNLASARLRVAGRRGVKFDLSNAAYDSLCIYADGRVYPSAASAGYRPLALGSALQSSLREVWLDSPLAQALRRATVIEKAECSECYLKFICGGGDIEHSYFYSTGAGSWFAPDPFSKLHEWLILEAMFSIAEERARLLARSGFDRPVVFYAMGEGAIEDARENGYRRLAEFEVRTSHSTCVLSFDLERSRQAVRRFYARAATQPQVELCCAGSYAGDEVAHIPQEALEVAYGCGSPIGAAEIKEGETFVDLGSGGGIDCFIAAKKVGPSGRVVGIDMTDEMLARANAGRAKVAERLGYDVVEFKRGYLEEIPLPDRFADVVASNCVINLSPDKKRVFLEIWRILKDHGRFVISDTIAAEKVPDAMRSNPRLWGECVSGALTEEEYLAYLERAGFYGIAVLSKSFWREVEGKKFYSAIIRGYKAEKRPGLLPMGRKAIYRGPFKAVIDEGGQLYPRGQAVEVSPETAARLLRPPYSPFFVIIGPDGEPEQAGDCCAQTSCCG